jgi:hypothetical protein
LPRSDPDGCGVTAAPPGVSIAMPRKMDASKVKK